jgi:CheY-like chemotaxis protein
VTAASPAPDRARVLVIDDDHDIREILGEILLEQGYSVSTAPDGAVALERLRGGERPDLILLDLAMPRCTGWEFRAQQAQDPTLLAIPVIVLSAEHDVSARVLQLGVAGFLSKPVDLDRLLEVVREQLGD